jgi:hypothetical protein
MKRNIPKAVREYMAALGRKGGKSKSPSKGGTSEQHRLAVMARWNARKSEQKETA